MELFILGSLSSCMLFFLVMTCINLIGIEKKIVDTVNIVEHEVKSLYNE
jgi:hypothetical protein